jgi:putative endonuclease
MSSLCAPWALRALPRAQRGGQRSNLTSCHRERNEMERGDLLLIPVNPLISIPLVPKRSLRLLSLRAPNASLGAWQSPPQKAGDRFVALNSKASRDDTVVVAVISNNMTHQYCVYILTNENNTVLYTGVTNNIHRRVREHKEGRGSKFTKRYNVHKLVYFEQTDDVNAAITREKQIKAGSRQKKIDLIDSINPEWRDLAEEI